MTVSETIDIRALVAEYADAANATLPRLCAATTSSVLRAIIDRLDPVRSRLREGKIAANLNGSCHLPDQLLGAECLIASMLHEARMWLGLREERHHEAWREFVDAEQYIQLGLRTPVAPEFERAYADRFAQMQRVLFPAMMYVSCGYNHGPGLCTICNQPLNECDHVKGEIYAGQVCAEYDFQSFDVDHVAIVEQPMSKHCYISHHRHPNEDWLDRLSGETVPWEPGEKEIEAGTLLKAKVVLFQNRLPVGARL